jgi:Na+-transporting methylmalonyl-CoA/oxaloacetate decarboxylase gamma subunit
MEQELNLFFEGIPIAIVGYLIVFAALVVFFFVFTYLGKILEYQARRRCEKAGKVKCAETDEFSINGEVAAAISMALHLHFNEMHDIESGKLTMKRISRRYTPWNSKIYNVMNRL